MSHPNFLRSIAGYYSEGVPGRTPHADVVYVLPNKRSAAFLKKHIQVCTKLPSRMPRIKTMGALMADFSGLPEASPRELLFILYKSYCRAIAEAGRSNVPEFDSFVFLGMLMMSDFDEIDRSLADTTQLFKNLRTLREIQADYLEPEQKETIRRIWGDSPMTREGENFWLHIGEKETGNKHLNTFISLWDVIASVYKLYHATLDEKQMASPGSQFRKAWNTVKELTADTVDNDHAHYVFVGFNDLSHAEALIFKHLQKIGKASFFWDTAPLKLADPSTCPEALVLLQKLVKEFPMPADYTCPVPDKMPEVTVVSVPSNVAQASALMDILGAWVKDKKLDPVNPLNTAIVLPDRELLTPVLFAIPEELKTVNITMQMSFRSTSYATLLQSIVRMQTQARKLQGRIHYYYEHVADVFNHPHIRTIAREDADRALEKIRTDKLFNIDAEAFANDFPGLDALLQPMANLTGVDETAKYTTRVLNWITDSLHAKAGRDTFETSITEKLVSEINSIAGLARKYDIEMRPDTFMRMFERVINSSGLTLNGTPLQGLQILGVLESRALDFDNVAFLSMNDGIFPRKQYAGTLIPNNLRHVFGLPDVENLELTYAYSFYRLISRASNVVLLYDARTNGQNAERSRYITQLQYLMPKVKVTDTAVTLIGSAGGEREITVVKTPEVINRLNDFKAGGALRLSATAIKCYLHCPLQFYIQYAARQRTTDEPVDNISTAEYGTIVHNTIQALFQPMAGRLVDRTFYNRLTDPANDEILKEVYKQLAEMKQRRDSDFTNEMEVAADLIEQIVRNDLIAECNYYCADGASFTFVKNEMPGPSGVWQISPGLAINWRMSVDRVDRIDADTLRFIDIKTGNDSPDAHSIERITAPKSIYSNDAVLQVFTYCQAYLDMLRAEGKALVDIEPVIQNTRSFFSIPNVAPVTVDKKPVLRYSQVEAEFGKRIKELIEEIFDPSRPFIQCKHSRTCNYCSFRSVCGRKLYTKY